MDVGDLAAGQAGLCRKGRPPPGEAGLVAGIPDQPDAAGTLKLRFKYYQRVEGVLRLPMGTRITALTARVYEDGSTMPRATRTLSIP